MIKFPQVFTICLKLDYFPHLASICNLQGSSIIVFTQIVANMKTTIFLLFAICLQDNFITKTESKVIQNNDRETLKNDVGVKNQQSLKSRGKGRIIGGNEIEAHSQPWLALLCLTTTSNQIW